MSCDITSYLLWNLRFKATNPSLVGTLDLYFYTFVSLIKSNMSYGPLFVGAWVSRGAVMNQFSLYVVVHSGGHVLLSSCNVVDSILLLSSLQVDLTVHWCGFIVQLLVFIANEVIWVLLSMQRITPTHLQPHTNQKGHSYIKCFPLSI